MTAVLPGMRAQWSRRVTVADCAGTPREWHLLDTHSTGATSDAAAWTGERPRLTLLCVHGNPTWSYIFRGLLAAAPPDVRVVAVDQLDMGLSERTDVPRTLANRIDDLDSLTSALGLVDVSPVVTSTHSVRPSRIRMTKVRSVVEATLAVGTKVDGTVRRTGQRT